MRCAAQESARARQIPRARAQRALGTPLTATQRRIPAFSAKGAADAEAAQSKVKIGLGGIHVLDGDDYVHVSWRDGVHVHDGKKGDEVHVGWDGVHVKEGRAATGDARSERNAERDARHAERDARRAAGRQGDWFSASDDGFAAADDEGNEVHVDSSGVVINGEHFDSWQDAHARYGYGHLHEERWNEPCGYTVCGERFDTLEQARAKYGDGVGTTIPVRKHYLRAFEKSWAKFPYPLVVILAYLLLGIFDGAWGMGLFLFFTSRCTTCWGTPSAANALRRSCRARTPSAWWHGSASWRSS